MNHKITITYITWIRDPFRADVCGYTTGLGGQGPDDKHHWTLDFTDKLDFIKYLVKYIMENIK